MKRGAYYNEIDPYAAQWLRNLIAEGHIAPGDVDERSILDVEPSDLRPYAQCHFFAGIGVWSAALRLAGWGDDSEVWTGSCPCQPFSLAGKNVGFDDERHLWPYWHYLIEQCRPNVVFGEQVEAAIRHGWLDLVQSDLEGIGYAVAPVGIPAAGVGAPHIRQRLWFVADTLQPRWAERGAVAGGRPPTGLRRAAGGLADGSKQRLDGEHSLLQPGGQDENCPEAARGGSPSRMGDDDDARLERLPRHGDDGQRRTEPIGPTTTAGAVNGYWADADWLPCKDGKYRPVEPGTFPLAHGAPARVGRLRAYGNAIVPQVAAEVIRAYLDHTNDLLITDLL